MALGVEIPVVPVMHQPLGRDFALRGFISLPVEMGDLDPLPGKQAGAEHFKGLDSNRACGHGQDANAAADFLQ